MKFIDKRGMIFGKINIIDLMVVIFILSLTPMFWFGYKLFTRPQPQPQLQPQPINWEQKYNEEQTGCEKRRMEDLQEWQNKYDKAIKKYDEEIAQKEKAFKAHPRLKKIFK